jgi:hypothetical protein
MTYTVYTYQQLQRKTIARLKQIYNEIACTVEVSGKRCKEGWISAIVDYQASKVQKVADVVDEQSTAKAELDNHIAAQAQAVASELTTVEINSNHFEVYAGKWLLAYITYDWGELVTQPWVVMVNGVEKFRHSTQAWCYRFIQWHHKQGTLNPQPNTEIPEVPFISEICFYDQEALVGGELVAGITYTHDQRQNPEWRVIVNNMEIFRDTTPARCHSYIKQQYQAGTLPVQQPFEEPCTSDNRVQAHIFNECQNYGFEILDDGIYQNDVKLGEVGCSNGNWWFTRATDSTQQRIPCDSALDAVWWLSMVDVSLATEPVDEYLQYRSLEQLTGEELQRLLEKAELVAA